uniref:Exonuclease 1 n=1 Tax=Macrostomum lignano TaxID=282301 RepID=A0A1I8F2N1_9PLAT
RRRKFLGSVAEAAAAPESASSGFARSPPRCSSRAGASALPIGCQGKRSLGASSDWYSEFEPAGQAERRGPGHSPNCPASSEEAPSHSDAAAKAAPGAKTSSTTSDDRRHLCSGLRLTSTQTMITTAAPSNSSMADRQAITVSLAPTLPKPPPPTNVVGLHDNAVEPGGGAAARQLPGVTGAHTQLKLLTGVAAQRLANQHQAGGAVHAEPMAELHRVHSFVFEAGRGVGLNVVGVLGAWTRQLGAPAVVCCWGEIRGPGRWRCGRVASALNHFSGHRPEASASMVCQAGVTVTSAIAFGADPSRTTLRVEALYSARTLPCIPDENPPEKLHLADHFQYANWPVQTVAVDTYCWLHKGAYACAEKLGSGQDTDQYVHYCMRYLRLLLANRLKVVLLLAEGRSAEAREAFERCIDVTPSMALALMREGADTIVAPYEADAQLTHLCNAGLVDAVISEDSGPASVRVIFKLDSQGNGLLMDRRQIARQFSRWMCILSGCDYFSGVPGVGLATAAGIVKRTCLDLRGLANKLFLYAKKVQRLSGIRSYPTSPMPIEHSTHRLQNPRRKRHQILDFAGSILSDNALALQLAHGNVDFRTMEPVADFDPADIGTPNNNKNIPTTNSSKNTVAAAPPSLHRCGEPTQLTASALAPLHLARLALAVLNDSVDYSISSLSSDSLLAAEVATVAETDEKENSETSARLDDEIPANQAWPADVVEIADLTPSDAPATSGSQQQLRQPEFQSDALEPARKKSRSVSSNNAPFKSPTLSNSKPAAFGADRSSLLDRFSASRPAQIGGSGDTAVDDD